MRKLTIVYKDKNDIVFNGLSNNDLIYMTFYLDRTIELNISPMYSYNKFLNVLDRCKKKDDCIDTVFLKNYPYLKIYIKNILKEVFDPLVLSGVLNPTRTLIIDGLDRIFSNNTCDIINLVNDFSNYTKHEFNVKLDIRILLNEYERF